MLIRRIRVHPRPIALLRDFFVSWCLRVCDGGMDATSLRLCDFAPLRFFLRCFAALAPLRFNNICCEPARGIAIGSGTVIGTDEDGPVTDIVPIFLEEPSNARPEDSAEC